MSDDRTEFVALVRLKRPEDLDKVREHIAGWPGARITRPEKPEVRFPGTICAQKGSLGGYFLTHKSGKQINIPSRLIEAVFDTHVVGPIWRP